MNSYDILLYLFENVQSSREGSGRALASCARVCRVWQQPASYVLWRKLPALHPLWNLLAKRNFSQEAKWLSPFWQFIDVDDFVNDIVAKERERWAYFLHRASHVREVSVIACGRNELALIRALTQHNKGKSLLPSLQRLSWRHMVPTDTTALLLSTTFLRDLEVTVSRIGTDSSVTIPSIIAPGSCEVDPIFTGLVGRAPLLRRLTLSGRQGPGSAIVPHLLRFSHLHELLLYNQSITVNPEQMKAIIENMGVLETLHASVVDFVCTELTAEACSLQVLRVKGDALQLQALLSRFLNAPFLRCLTLQASEEAPSHKSYQLFPLIAQASFGTTLRSVSVTLLNEDDVVWNDPTAHSYSTIIGPLFALKNLQDVDIYLGSCLIPFADADVAAIAQAWVRVHRLQIAYAPFRPHTRPPFTSLQHFAVHCPQLHQLSMTKLTIPDLLDLPNIPDTREHPLRFLDLKMTFARNSERSGLEKRTMARYINHLFPCLDLGHRDSEVQGGVSDEAPGMFTWRAVKQEIRILRQSRLTNM